MGLIQIQGHSVIPRFLSASSVVFDMGSNHGDFGHAIVKRFGCRCIAVEANRSLADGIRQIGGMEVVHAAVGGSDGSIELAITRNDQCSSILKGSAAETLRTERVRMISLASLFADAKVDYVDLVKMDIEGAEIMALDACPDALLGQIGQLAVEFHESLGLTSLAELNRVCGRLESLGFELIRGTFTNYEDNLFVNRSRCPLTRIELFNDRTCCRVLNGVKRVFGRIRTRNQSALSE